MKIKNYISPSIFLTLAFVLSIFMLFFIGSISFKQIQTLSHSQQAIIRSLEVRINLEKLFSELKDSEAAHRGYLITREPLYLEPYNYSHVRINKSLIAIRNLTENNSRRQQDFDALSVMIDTRFRYLRDNLIESNRMQTSSDSFRSKMWEGKTMMDNIREQINTIITHEQSILEKQEQQHGDEISFTPFTSLFLVIFSVIIFLFTFHRIYKNIHELKLLNRKLQLMNETFTYAEKIGEICHWHFDIATKVLIFSDNKFNLLGCSPQSFTPNIDRFLEFVHPHDRKKVRDSFVKEHTSESLSIYFRIIRKDKKIRYFKSISKLTIDSEGKEIIIGIDCDVTTQHHNMIKLERKNNELKSINAELSSFNHIVSHDLQEPLRKIQMFISRVDENDLALISETSRNYFSRMYSSASRAQKLIDDLLMYSRVNKSQKNYEFTDLNLLLENAKNDLIRVIEEKQARITSETLPSIKVIPYQIQQLFVNLISNSLKYSKKEECPHLRITYCIVESKDFPELKLTGNKKFHQISVIDNGIGFSQEYASRIFVLFHRLHNKDKYSGTGIGLAICKKMAENHRGSIFAYGEPNIGATFKIFLPV